MSPWPPGMCCICFCGITVEEAAMDETGQRWDVHAGRCPHCGDPCEAQGMPKVPEQVPLRHGEVPLG